MHLKGPGFEAQGVAVPGLAMYLLIGRTPGLRVEPDLGRTRRARRVSWRSCARPNGSAPTRASTHYNFKGECRAMESFNAGTLGTRPAHLQPDGARAGVRDGHGGREAVRALPPPLDVRPRRPQPRRVEADDRGQGAHAGPLLEDRQQVRLHLQLGLGLAEPRDGVLLLRLSSRARARARSTPADPRHRPVRMAVLPEQEQAPARRHRARTGCCSTGTTARRRASCTATTSRTARCSGWRTSTSGRRSRRSPTTSAS